MMGKQDGWTFIHNEAKDAVWEKGLRENLSYRYLSTDASTDGAYVAQVIRNNGEEQKNGGIGKWHVHDCTFQMTYVLKGWATFEWEGAGVRTIHEGDCINQIPMIKHRELAMSEDFEVLEIVAPADFKTYVVDPPVDDIQVGGNR
jgi:quercetin dioxygenase-like cupin family protein